MGRDPFVKVQLAGAKSTEDALRKLPPRMQRAAIRRVMIALAAPMVSDAQSEIDTAAPKGSGATKRIIRVSATLSRRQKRGETKGKDEIKIYVGVGPSRKAHLIELGTGPRYTKTGAYRGEMPANPYIAVAFRANAMDYLKQLGPALGKEVEKTAARYYRRLRSQRGG